MATTAITERLTYDQWRKLPESNRPCEVVDGVIQMPPAPFSYHGWIADNVLECLRPFVRSRGLGVVMSAPVDVLVQKEPLRARQPDVLFLSAERTGIRGAEDLQAMPVIEVPPDLVVEVLSPGETRARVRDKLQDYQAIGVRECWLISPEGETIEVLRLTGKGCERSGLFGAGDNVRSEVLPDLDFAVDAAFV